MQSKGRGRPKGTGPKMVAVEELIKMLGGDAEVPVPYKWLENLGVDPTSYSPWNRKAIKATPINNKEEAQEENTVLFTITP
jgi:hypothetical protein